MRRWAKHAMVLAILVASVALGTPAASAQTDPDDSNEYETVETVEAVAAYRIAPAIIGGSPTALAEFPFMAYLDIQGSGPARCGGTLIRLDVILTAAHCAQNAALVEATAGNLVAPNGPVTAEEQVRISTSIDVHPAWNGNIADAFDVALIHFNQPFVLTAAVQPVKLAPTSMIAGAATATIVGWGATAPNSFSGSPQLLSTTVDVVNDAACAAAYSQLVVTFIDDQWVCAGSATNGTCFGDSGGPLAVFDGGEYFQIGVTSFGSSVCGETPGGFMDIGFVRSWIIDSVAPLSCVGRVVDIDIGLGQVPTSGSDVIHGTHTIDSIDAGTGNDVICAGDGDDVVNGGPGDDWVAGGGGEDVLFGGDGDDMLRGQAGNDSIWGDELTGGIAGADVIKGGAGSDQLHGLGGNDVINGGGGVDEIFGGDGADVIDGRGAGDFLYGGAGADEISGQKGADEIWGGAASDELSGQTGPDVFHGEGGGDTMVGGAGNDMFYGGRGIDKCSGNIGNGDQAEQATCEQTPGVESLF